MKINHLLGDGFCPPSTAASHSKGPSTMRVFFRGETLLWWYDWIHVAKAPLRCFFRGGTAKYHLSSRWTSQTDPLTDIVKTVRGDCDVVPHWRGKGVCPSHISIWTAEIDWVATLYSNGWRGEPMFGQLVPLLVPREKKVGSTSKVAGP